MTRFLRLGCIAIVASACVLDAAQPGPGIWGDAGRAPDDTNFGSAGSSVAMASTGGSVSGAAGVSVGTTGGSPVGSGPGGAPSSTSDAGRDVAIVGAGSGAGGAAQAGAGGRGGGGSPSGSGGASSSKVDASAPAMDAAVNYNTPLVCTSGDHWTNGDHGASSMHPGVACIACHSMKNGPAFAIAGTIFPTAHEPDDCNGADGLFTGAVVQITGADGQTVSVIPNVAGNFNIATNTKIALPFRAKVVAGNRERAMQTPQMIGDCNSCHTVTGLNGAPGRIMVP